MERQVRGESGERKWVVESWERKCGKKVDRESGERRKGEKMGIKSRGKSGGEKVKESWREK